MSPVLMAFLAAIRASVQARAELEAEILALRHQLAVLQRAAPKRPHLSRADACCGCSLPGLDGLAPECPGRTTCHGRPLASPRFRAVLAMAFTPPSSGPTGGGPGHPRADPADAIRESALGRPAHSRRTAQIGHRGLTNHR